LAHCFVAQLRWADISKGTLVKFKWENNSIFNAQFLVKAAKSSCVKMIKLSRIKLSVFFLPELLVCYIDKTWVSHLAFLRLEALVL
jgi:hypothetical protein